MEHSWRSENNLLESAFSSTVGVSRVELYLSAFTP